MAGRPVRRRLLQAIKDAGGWGAIFDRVASGDTQSAIAKEFGVSQGFFSRIIGQDPDRKMQFREPLRTSAQARADRALEIAESVKPDRDEVQKARLVTDIHRWLARSYDRETFGDETPAGVTINLGQLHLEAIRVRPAALPTAPAQLTAGETDHEPEE